MMYGKNCEGYSDPTATAAISTVSKEEQERIRPVLNCIRCVAELAGFEIIGRVVFKQKDTGKVFR